jgi:hypothetical protein
MLVWEEDEMNRRELVIAGLSVPFVSTAKAQVVAGTFDQVTGLGELWVIINALEAMIFLIVSIKAPEAIAQTRQEFIPFEFQLTQDDAVKTFNEALQSQHGMERAKQQLASINQAADKIANFLSQTSCSQSSLTSIVNSFRRGSILLSAAYPAADDSWWCHLYGLRLLLC